MLLVGQMQSHGNLLLRLYGQARGRAAEYWGRNTNQISGCKLWVSQSAQEWYKAQSPAFRSYLDAFAAGINAMLKSMLIKSMTKLKPYCQLMRWMCWLTISVCLISFCCRSGKRCQRKDNRKPIGSNAWAIAPAHSATSGAMLLANPLV